MRRTSAVLVAVATTALALAGCGSSGGSSGTQATTSSSPSASGSVTTTPSSSAAPGLTLDITVHGKQVTPAPTTVQGEPGEAVSMTLTSDRGGELHVHAADPELETEVVPGTNTYTFNLVSQPGEYEVELHDPDLLLVTIRVQ